MLQILTENNLSRRVNSLDQFVETAFELAGLDWRDHVEVDKTLYRPTDIRRGYGRPDKAARELEWQASMHMREVIAGMLKAELE